MSSSTLPVPVQRRFTLAPVERQRAAAPATRGHAGFKLPLLLAVLAAIGTSLMLIPRGLEMAQLQLEAGDAHGARALLEQRYAAGEHSPAIVASLAALRAHTGDVPGAVALLEPLALERPQDQEILEALLTYRRQQTNEPAGLLRVLLMLDALAPSAPRQREIAWLHGQLGQVAQQRAVLRRLVAAGDGVPPDYLALARLEAAAGATAAALDALRDLAEAHPRAIDTDAAALAVALQVEAGQVETAANAASAWLARQDRDAAGAAAPILAGILSGAGRPDLVRRLLAPLARPDAPAPLTIALAQAEIDIGEPAAALARLAALPDAQVGRTPELRMLRLRVALALGLAERAANDLVALAPSAVPDGLAAQIAESALVAGQRDVLGRLLNWGGADLLAAAPGLAAEVALSLGDHDAAAGWANAALASAPPATAARALGLVATLAALNRSEDAATVLARLAAAPGVTQPVLLSVARGYLRLGRAEQGAAEFATLRAQAPSAMLEAPWALMSAAVLRHESSVVAWLDTQAGTAAPSVLRDILHVAADAGARTAAATAALRLIAQQDSDTDRLLLARLLMAADRPGEALDHLRILAARGAPDSALYEAALHAAWRQGDPVGAELRALWVGRLAAAETPQARQAAMAMLREIGAESDVLPTLRQMAEAEPERWLWAYSEAAARARRPQEAQALWAVMARRNDLPPALRRQIAFGLLERGAKAAAEAAFRNLAATAPPDSTEVRQLLFVWGQRPLRSELAWLEARARAATGAEKAAWMRLLTERGASARAIAVYRAAGGHDESAPLREAYLTALSVAQDRAGLAAVVREELPRETSTERLRALAILAGQSGNGALEDRVLRALVLAGGGDAAQRQRVGLAAWRDGDLVLAGRLLDERVRADGGTAEMLFILGEIRDRQGDTAAAQRQREAALLRISADGDTSLAARRMQATLLRRLGRSRDALPVYEALLAEQPDDRHLRADLVSLLIELRNYRRAQTVLAER